MAVACCNADELCATIYNVRSVESLRSKLACTDSCNALEVFRRLITHNMKVSRHGAGLLSPAPTVHFTVRVTATVCERLGAFAFYGVFWIMPFGICRCKATVRIRSPCT